MAGNKKPRKPYKRRPTLSILPTKVRTDIEIGFHLIDSKLAAGLFDEVDCNTVAYVFNVAHRLAVTSSNEPMKKRMDAAFAALRSIRLRKERTGKWGAAGAELLALREHLGPIARYFSEAPCHKLHEARKYVLEANERLRAAKVLYADIQDDGTLMNVDQVPGAEPMRETA